MRQITGSRFHASRIKGDGLGLRLCIFGRWRILFSTMPSHPYCNFTYDMQVSPHAHVYVTEKIEDRIVQTPVEVMLDCALSLT